MNSTRIIISLSCCIALTACDAAAVANLHPQRSFNDAVLSMSSSPIPPRESEDVALRDNSSDNKSVKYRLYVANSGNNSITVYNFAAQGNASPLYVISGSNTALNLTGQFDGQLSEDSAGNLYVANGMSILVFSQGAKGNVAPIRTLSGSLTGIQNATAATVDQVTGKLFVFNAITNGEGSSNLLRFPPDAGGNEAPFAISQTEFGIANEVASDSTGLNVIESTNGECCNGGSAGIVTAPKQFPNGGSDPWLYDISWFGNRGVADDALSKSFFSTSSGIYHFAENTVGHGQTPGPGPTFTPAVLSINSGDTCGGQMAIGHLRNVYVAHGVQHGCQVDAIYVYAYNASGNANPIRVLAGPSTLLNQPTGVYEGL